MHTQNLVKNMKQFLQDLLCSTLIAVFMMGIFYLWVDASAKEHDMIVEKHKEHIREFVRD